MLQWHHVHRRIGAIFGSKHVQETELAKRAREAFCVRTALRLSQRGHAELLQVWVSRAVGGTRFGPLILLFKIVRHILYVLRMML
jgi:hypothetical protein